MEPLAARVRVLNELVDRQKTPRPNQGATAFAAVDAFPGTLPGEPLNAVNPASTGRDAKFASFGDRLPGLYGVNSGDPYASGLFSTDNLDPRPPESQAWKGNHGFLGPGRLSYDQQVARAFDGMRLPTGDGMESTQLPPSPTQDKTGAYVRGAVAAYRRLAWR